MPERFDQAIFINRAGRTPEGQIFIRQIFLHAAILIFIVTAASHVCAGGVLPQPEPSPTPTPAATPEIIENIDEKIEEIRDWKLERGAIEFGVELGFAPTQPVFLSGDKEYDTSGRKFVMGSVRVGRVIGTVKGVTYQYFFEVIPVSFALKNEVVNPQYVSEKETPLVPPTIRETTYGFGIQPAGFRFIFMPKRRLKPYIQLGAGFIFTSKPVPVPQSPNYNFIGDFGGGLMYSVKKRQTINFNYRYFHISNMNIGVINPGYNANVFSIGYSFFSK